MDFICDICSFIGNSFIFDKIWWKDYGIPLLGAVLIPTSVWYFGSVRAEEQKELKGLRDNLNLLLSVCLDAISKLTSLRSSLLKISNIENKKIEEITNEDVREIAKVLSSPIDFSLINVANYSPCIAYSENYVLDLLKIISALKIKDFKIDHHNYQIKSISETQDLSSKIIKLKEVIDIEAKELPKFIKEIEGLIILLRNFIDTSKDLENKIKRLKLDNIKFNEEQLALFKELEDNIQTLKEQENDK